MSSCACYVLLHSSFIITLAVLYRLHLLWLRTMTCEQWPAAVFSKLCIGRAIFNTLIFARILIISLYGYHLGMAIIPAPNGAGSGDKNQGRVLFSYLGLVRAR